MKIPRMSHHQIFRESYKNYFKLSKYLRACWSIKKIETHVKSNTFPNLRSFYKIM